MFHYIETPNFMVPVDVLFPDAKGDMQEAIFKASFRHISPEDFTALQDRVGKAQQEVAAAMAGNGGSMSAVTKVRHEIAREHLVAVSGIGNKEGEYPPEKQLAIVHGNASLLATCGEVFMESNNAAKRGNSSPSRRR